MDNQKVALLYGLILAVSGVPMALAWIPPNGFYGMRTRRTLLDRECWYRVNRFAGAAIVVAGFAIVGCARLLPAAAVDRWLPAILVAPIVAVLIASLVYERRACGARERRAGDRGSLPPRGEGRSIGP